jgi:hypothetical protein
VFKKTFCLVVWKFHTLLKWLEVWERRNDAPVQQHICEEAVWGAREVPLPTADGTFVPRSAVVCTVNGICIANVHLTGGRYDDLKAHLASDIKDQQLRYLVDACDPDVIVGDFNRPTRADVSGGIVCGLFSRGPQVGVSGVFHGRSCVPYVLNITATPPARNQSALAAKLGN